MEYNKVIAYHISEMRYELLNKTLSASENKNIF